MHKVKTLKSVKKSSDPLIFLLVKFLLIKIGEMPIFLIKLIFFYPIRTWTLISKIRISIPININKKRGRPRKMPLTRFYYQRLHKFLYSHISKSVRVVLLLSVLSLSFFGYTFLTFKLSSELPSPTRLVTADKPQTTEFYDRNGKLLYKLYEGMNRSLVKINELPAFVPQATIAIEDKNFYSHIGIDPLAILRATYENYKSGTLQGGASTITQQLVKNTLLTPEKTYSRKIKEIILSFWVERMYSKQDILQMYLNEVAYGGPAWGIEAASEMYFGKQAKDLDLAQASFLAGLTASPTQYSPYGGRPELAKQRQKEVLRRMVEDNYITRDQADQAEAEELNIKTASSDIKAPHFVMFIKDSLSQKYGPRVVSQGGLKIYTTLDLNIQQKAEQIVSEEVTNLANLNVKNGAAMVTDPKTGQILAMIGSRDYHYSGYGNFNVTTSVRSPGSSIKPITYATAFKQGFSPGNSILDIPVAFKDEWGNSYSPINYDEKFHGPVSLRTSLGSSYNIPAVKLLQTIGINNMIQTAQDLGITTFTDTKNYGLSITLGGGGVKMIDMMSVYGTFAQMGQKNTPTGILKVVDGSGNILEEYQNTPKQVLTPQVAFLINDILSDNKARTPAFGANSLLNVSGTAVKTGTSDIKRDNWTFGYTPDFVVGVWVGNNDNSPLDPHLASGITGAAPIWNKIMKSILTDHPSIGFIRPDGIAEAVIDGRKDFKITDSSAKTLVKIRKDADMIHFSDDFSVYATSSAVVSIKDNTTN